MKIKEPEHHIVKLLFLGEEVYAIFEIANESLDVQIE